MSLNTLVHKSTVYIDANAHSRTAVLLRLSQLLSDEHKVLNADILFEAYWKRESLGCTAIGHGILIPHVRSENVTKPCGCFLKLENPIDFGAADKQPVDLVFGLVAPINNPELHLNTLSEIIKKFNDEAFRKACRKCSNSVELYSLLTGESISECNETELETQ